ncbi:MAG: efflux transporter outer membrane subunit [Gemmatimonadota bacterium]
MTRALIRHAACALVAALLAACASVPPARPALELPEASSAAPAGIDRFWTRFNDAQLAALIDEALARNLDLRAAIARIDEARANLRLARSALYPSLDAQLGANRNRASEATAQQFPGPHTTTSYSAGLNASYEVDVWGKYARGRDAAQASLLATRYAAETVRIALVGAVATAYFTLRANDAELALAKETLKTRDENVRLQKQRFDAGVASDYDLKLAQAERAAVAAVIPAAERAVAQSEAALAVLTGRSPKAVYMPAIARGADIDAAVALEVPPGLPSDLLARRPDIQQAEAQLAAADARIDEARAQYYPSLTLTASFGGESAELSDLLTAPARVWSIGAGLLQPIIGAQRIGAQVDAATARREQALIAYQQAVQAAFRDVHDALAAHSSAREAFTAQEQRRASLGDALKLAEKRYRGGYSSYIEVLDAQRNLLDAERARLTALRDRQAAIVDLYKALGGGWDPEQLQAKAR